MTEKIDLISGMKAYYGLDQTLVDNDLMKDRILMPRELTAENGAKGKFSGEFYEFIEIECSNCDGTGFEEDEIKCDECDCIGHHLHKVYVSWTLLKKIYSEIVKQYGVEVSK